jgi:E3 ubiquitin-protein ligase BRE1
MQLAKRDVDLNRIRENRDTLQAELHDKKILMQAQSDGQRLAKNLANTRYVRDTQSFSFPIKPMGTLKERIKTLNKEVTRLRQRLAAQAGDEDLLEFLLREGDSEVALSENIIRVNR